MASLLKSVISIYFICLDFNFLHQRQGPTWLIGGSFLHRSLQIKPAVNMLRQRNKQMEHVHCLLLLCVEQCHLSKWAGTWPFWGFLKKASWLSWVLQWPPTPSMSGGSTVLFLMFRMYPRVWEKVNSGPSVSTAAKGTSWGRLIVHSVLFLFSCFSAANVGKHYAVLCSANFVFLHYFLYIFVLIFLPRLKVWSGSWHHAFRF